MPRLLYFPFLLFLSLENRFLCFFFSSFFLFYLLRFSFDTIIRILGIKKLLSPLFEIVFEARDRNEGEARKNLIEHRRDVLNYSNAKACDIPRGFDNFFNPARRILSRRYIFFRILFLAFLSFFFFFYLPHFARIEGKIERLELDSSRFIPS